MGNNKTACRRRISGMVFVVKIFLWYKIFMYVVYFVTGVSVLLAALLFIFKKYFAA